MSLAPPHQPHSMITQIREACDTGRILVFAMARTTIRQHADVRDGVEAIAFTGTETPLNDTRQIH
jgi:hypothetical protein